MVPQEGTQDKVLGLIPVHGGPGPHCSAAGMRVGVGAAVWGRYWETDAGVSEMGLEDGIRDAHRSRALETAAGCRGGNSVVELGGGSSRLDVQRRGHDGGRGEGHGGVECGGGDCCFHDNDGDCCGCDGGVESDDPFDCADASWEGCGGCVQACGISLACSEDEVCGWEAAPKGAWEKRGLRWDQSLDPTLTAARDVAFWGSGYHPFCLGPHCTHYLDENVALLPQDDVCVVHGSSGAVLLQTYNSPVCAAGSPGDCGRGGGTPSRDYSAAGSSLLRWRSLGSHSPQRSLRCSHRSHRSGRSLSGTESESWGGPWPGAGQRGREVFWGDGPFDTDRTSSSCGLPILLLTSDGYRYTERSHLTTSFALISATHTSSAPEADPHLLLSLFIGRACT